MLMVSSKTRGETLYMTEGEAAAELVSALDHLTPFQLKFALNAAQDTLYLIMPTSHSKRATPVHASCVVNGKHFCPCSTLAA